MNLWRLHYRCSALPLSYRLKEVRGKSKSTSKKKEKGKLDREKRRDKYKKKREEITEKGSEERSS